MCDQRVKVRDRRRMVMCVSCVQDVHYYGLHALNASGLRQFAVGALICWWLNRFVREAQLIVYHYNL